MPLKEADLDYLLKKVVNPLFKCAYDREKLNQNAISLDKFTLLFVSY